MNLKLTRFTFQTLLAVLLLVGAIPAKAAQSGDFTYTATATAVTITGYTGSGGAVTIPSSIGGLPVTSIGTIAFGSKTSLTSVAIPNSVSSIGGAAFSGCTGLTGMTIPNSITSIGGSAFQGCTGLTSMTIDNSVTSIGFAAFYGCTGLTSVTFGNSVTNIEGYAFYSCYRLTGVTIPNSITSIGVEAFYGCAGLTNVTIPNSVTSIEDRAFIGCTGLTSATIGSGVTSIGDGAFQDCTGLTIGTIGNSLTSIGRNAFSNCINLARIYFEGNAPSAGVAIFNNASPSIYYYAGTTGWGISFAGLPTAEALTFISQPVSVGCNQGRRATFTVSTTGAGVAYQWQKGGTDIPNATEATLTLTNVQAADVGSYTVVARNLEGSFTSTPASLTVYPDADGDGLTDADELIYGSNVNQGDTDGDGISDGDEVHRYLTNPTVKDTDGDGYEDGFEIGVGYSPTSAASTPQAVSRIHPAVEFEFSADLGVAYEIQQSLDLKNWTPIESNIIGQGRVETRFYSTQNQPKRYFRVNKN